MFFGNFFVKAISFITIPIFTNILSAAEFGEVSIFQTYLSIMIILICLHFDSALQIAKIDYKDEFQKYTSTMIKVSLIIFLIILCFVILNCNLIATILRIKSKYVILLFIFSYQSFIISYYMMYNITQLKYKANIFISIINTVGSVILSLIFVLWILSNDKGLGRILGIELVKTPIFIYIIFKMVSIKEKSTIADVKNYFNYTIKISIPQIFNHISHTIMGQCDRLVINFYLSMSEVGIYSITYTFGTIIEMIHNSIENVWRTWLFDQLNIGKIKVVKIFTDIYVILFSIMAITFSILIDTVFKTFIPLSYWDGLTIVIPIMLGVYFLFMASFYISIEYYTKQNKIIAFATTFIAAINIIGNILLIPIIGYYAAAYTTLFSYIFLYFFHFVVIVLVQKRRVYNDYRMLSYAIYTLIVCYIVNLIHLWFLKFIIGFILLLPLFYLSYKLLKMSKEIKNV